MSVRLHVERIVVEGLPLSSRDRLALGDAVERELGALLRGRDRSWPAGDVAVGRVAGGTVPIAAAGPAARAGTGIAAAIVDGISAGIAGPADQTGGAAVRR